MPLCNIISDIVLTNSETASYLKKNEKIAQRTLDRTLKAFLK